MWKLCSGCWLAQGLEHMQSWSLNTHSRKNLNWTWVGTASLAEATGSQSLQKVGVYDLELVESKLEGSTHLEGSPHQDVSDFSPTHSLATSQPESSRNCLRVAYSNQSTPCDGRLRPPRQRLLSPIIVGTSVLIRCHGLSLLLSSTDPSTCVSVPVWLE